MREISAKITPVPCARGPRTPQPPLALLVRYLKLAERGGFEPPIPCGITVFETAAFDNLSQVPSVPPHRCHPYEGSTLKFSVDLTRNYRLIFSPAGKYKVKDGVGIVRESVKEIIIEKIKDPH